MLVPLCKGTAGPKCIGWLQEKVLHFCHRAGFNPKLIHCIDTFLIQNFQSLYNLQTGIGTIKWFSSLRHWFHTTTKQNRGKEKEQPPCGWISAPHLRTSKQHFVSFFFFFPCSKTLPWRHSQETPLFLWGQCSASCAKINMASRQSILISCEWIADEAVQLWYLLCPTGQWKSIPSSP